MGDEAVILIVEDREDDILIIRKAFKEARLLNPLHVVRNGEEAIDYLRGTGKYWNREEYPLPDLVLLDLKMPRVDGFEVLRWVREQPTLKAMRIIVLTSSDRINDVTLAYQLGANSFLVKPLSFADFVLTSKVLKGYWLWMSKSPETSRPDLSNPITESSQDNRPNP